MRPAIITGDIAQLMDIFGKVVSARDLERSTKELQQLCQVMEIPTGQAHAETRRDVQRQHHLAAR